MNFKSAISRLEACKGRSYNCYSLIAWVPDLPKNNIYSLLAKAWVWMWTTFWVSPTTVDCLPIYSIMPFWMISSLLFFDWIWLVLCTWGIDEVYFEGVVCAFLLAWLVFCLITLRLCYPFSSETISSASSLSFKSNSLCLAKPFLPPSC